MLQWLKDFWAKIMGPAPYDEDDDDKGGQRERPEPPLPPDGA